MSLRSSLRVVECSISRQRASKEPSSSRSDTARTERGSVCSMSSSHTHTASRNLLTYWTLQNFFQKLVATISHDPTEPFSYTVDLLGSAHGNQAGVTTSRSLFRCVSKEMWMRSVQWVFFVVLCFGFLCFEFSRNKVRNKIILECLSTFLQYLLGTLRYPII